MCDSESRTWLIVVLSVWLVLSTARQAFDLIGKLWVPVAFNLFQMLSCITGLFAVCQYRICLLIALTVSSVISTVYNVLILLWYNGIFGDTTRPVLSAGLPYSYSFFLRHTPFCQAHFNLSSSLWVQSPCVVPFYQIESAQAIVHVTLALITVILSACLLWRRKRHPGFRYSDRNSVKQPKITVEFAGGANGGSRMKNGSASVANSGSGYMNSSYESADREVLGDRPAAPPQNGYIRQSARRPRVKAPRPPSCASAIYQQRSGGSDDYSAATTVEAGGSNTGRLSRRSCGDVSARRPRSGYLDEDWSDYEDPYAKPKARTGSMKSFKMAATEGVRRMLSHEQLTASNALGDRNSSQRCSGSNLTSLVSFDPKSNTLIRVREHFGEETDEDLYEVSNRASQRNAIAHAQESEDDGPPSTQAPVIDLTRSQYTPVVLDGCPNSMLIASSNDWVRRTNHGGYTMVGGGSYANVESLPPPPPRAAPPIGYEPALCDPPPDIGCDPARSAGITLSYEPIYRSAPQVPSTRKSTGHYHDPNALRLMAYESEPRGGPTVPVINDNSLLV